LGGAALDPIELTKRERQVFRAILEGAVSVRHRRPRSSSAISRKTAETVS
jgi:hypothetical protein